VTRSPKRHFGLRRRAARPVRTRFFPDAVQRADLALFRRTARWHAPVLDATLPKLTRSGNKSMLWLAISAVLYAFGERFGRRGALRGIFSIIVTSFITNIPAKLLWRRTRPLLDEVPQVRRLQRLPTSTSFPSGHSASAFAFATGVALEKPVVGVPLLGAAAAMAYSRVYVGVHYPSDVIAGAVIGAGMAVATRRFWPVAPDEPAHARSAPTTLSERPDPDGGGLTIVVNPSAGSGFSGPPTDELREALPGAEVIEIDDEITLDEALEKAAVAKAIGICGGDGTVNTAAHVAHTAGKPLLVIPGGTLNHFARAIGMNSLDDVVAAVKEGEAICVDVGMIDSKPFLNTASFGNYVDLVDARERLERQIGKWPAVVFALARVLRNAEPVAIEIDGKRTKAWMAFIGNSRYEPQGFAPAWRERLDDGILDVRIVSAREPFARVRLLWAVATGTLGNSKVYQTDVVRGPVKLRSLDGPIRLARDGETFQGSESFTIEKASEPLVVLIPPSDEDSSSSSTTERSTSSPRAEGTARR
jgi:diacylglycerol kinase family enzyme/membrane-associated phospholipid phosphatase